MNADTQRAHLMTAIHRADAAGFPHFAAALADLLRIQDKRPDPNHVPIFDRSNHDAKHTTTQRGN